MVRNRVVTKINLNKILLGLLGAFTDALRNFLCFSVADPDFTFLITDYDECCKAETATALYNFSTTVDVNDLLDVFRSFFRLVPLGK